MSCKFLTLLLTFTICLATQGIVDARPQCPFAAMLGGGGGGNGPDIFSTMLNAMGGGQRFGGGQGGYGGYGPGGGGFPGGGGGFNGNTNNVDNVAQYGRMRNANYQQRRGNAQGGGNFQRFGK